jgi:hypothetical protein
MLAIYTLAIFLSATLLFLVQPMAGKMILPLLGGTPGVWTTSMLFFQAVLLGGYAYAHIVSRMRLPRQQVILHLIVVAAAGLMLPIGLPAGEAPAPDAVPAAWTLYALAIMVGGPFFALSAAGPLLQSWFSRTDHPHAKDPYFLYAASNAGSMLALLAYPLLVEPNLGVRQQAWGWSGLYVLLLGLLVAAGVLLVRRSRVPAAGSAASPATLAPPAPIPSLAQSIRWVLLAAVASSLMLGTTTYLTLDVAAVPLLWVLPLAAYLLTFILAFLPGGWVLGRVAGWLFPLAAILAAIAFLHDWRGPLSVLFAIHLAALLLGAMQCHGRLSEERPHPEHLTRFYLLLAFGGVLGGLFNALVAPLAFNSLLEYPIALIAVLLLRAAGPRAAQPVSAPSQPGTTPPPPAPVPGSPIEWRLGGMLDVAMPLTIAVGFIALERGWVSAAPMAELVTRFQPDAWQHLTTGWWADVLIWLAPGVIALTLLPNRVRLALCIGLVLLAPVARAQFDKRALFSDRTFFGTLRVLESADTPRVHTLYHGRIMHGRQFVLPPASLEPTTYYSREGPVGDLFAAVRSAASARGPALRFAGVGMGTGTLLAYPREGDEFTFYEIDPGIVRIAQDANLFAYWEQSEATKRVVLGDARLTMARSQDGHYDLILLDAFSSDAIPVHLITREAIEMFTRKLKPGGVLAVHITNRYLNLEPVLERHARDLGLLARIRDDNVLTPARREAEHSVSTWVALASPSDEAAASRSLSPMATLAADPRWRELIPAPLQAADRVAWTDDYSDLLSVFIWR